MSTTHSASVDCSSTPEAELAAKEQEETKVWLNNQVLEYGSAVKAQDDRNIEEDEDIENMLQRIVQLQHELQEVSGVKYVRDLAVERAQMGDALVSHLYPPRADTQHGSGDAPTKPVDEELVLLLEKQADLSTEILHYQAAMRELQPELDKLRKENLELKACNRELMANLEALKEEQRTHTSLTQRSDVIARAQEKKEQIVAKLEVVRGVFRRLIIGSGVDWAQDPELTQTLIELGTPLDVLLSEDS